MLETKYQLQRSVCKARWQGALILLLLREKDNRTVSEKQKEICLTHVYQIKNIGSRRGGETEG